MTLLSYESLFSLRTDINDEANRRYLQLLCGVIYYVHEQRIHIAEDCPLSTGILYSRLQRVTTPDAVIIKLFPPEDGHVNARNMSWIIV